MKIVATISDFGAAANIGGNVEYTSEIIEIPEEMIPPNLKKHLDSVKKCAEKNQIVWSSLSFSLLVENK